MTDSRFKACAKRARGAGGVFAVTLLALLCLAASAAHVLAGARQEARKPAADGAASIVGVWQATLPNGVRAATVTIVPAAEGYAGTFVGYDYDRRIDPARQTEGPPPKVALRTGAVLTDLRLDGRVLAFKMYLRHPQPPPGKAVGFDVSGEVRFLGEGAAELRLSAPQKAEPLVLKLTRE